MRVCSGGFNGRWIDKITDPDSQTKTMPPAVKTVISLLRNHLDKQMLMFKKSNPEFYAGYVSARVIVDRGSRKSASPTPPAPTASK